MKNGLQVSECPSYRPVDRAAIGVVLRMLETAGIISALGELPTRVAATGYSVEEFEEGFASVVDDVGRVLGVRVHPHHVSGAWRDQLVTAGLAEVDPLGQLQFIGKGRTMLALLQAYAAPSQTWRSNIPERDKPEL
jgi:hypothetical protein